MSPRGDVGGVTGHEVRPDALDQRGVTARPGRDWSGVWTDQVDAALLLHLARMTRSGGVAVVALGSYARRALCPASDIDILLLHDGWGNKELQSLVRSICYPLWDNGLSVGHAVLTAREAVRGAQQAIDRATSLTDRRLVAGDAGLLDDLAARTDRWLRRQRTTLVENLARADEQRHVRDGPEPGMLEPDLKNGAGGLRDIDSLRWAAACMLGEPTLGALIGARYLAAAEHRQLREAGAALLETRCALHQVLGATRPGPGVDHLRLDVQDDVARTLGHASADYTLWRVGLAMRVIRHIHGRTWPRLLDDARAGRRQRKVGVTIPLEHDLLLVDGLIESAAGATVASDPSLPLRAVAAAAANRTSIGRATSEMIRRQIEEVDSLAWSEGSRTALLTLLRQGRHGLAAFADADHLGVLGAMLPDWRRVRGHPQRNPYHRFDLDTHLIRAVAELVDIAGGSVDPRHAAVAERLGAPDVLLLGTFLHDIGKPWPGDHSIVGAQRARQWVLDMGLGGSRAERVARLVRHHLLFPEVATSRDLDDPVEIRRVAELVEDSETADGLLLLSLADARATGPSAYSAWKENLLSELHTRVRAHLTGGAARWVKIAGPDVVVSQAREIVGNAAVDALLPGTHRRYLLAADAEQVAAHASLLAEVTQGTSNSGAGRLRASWRPGPTSQTGVVSVVAPDRHGLVADCAGVLAGYGLVVHEARAFTRHDGLALDWFVVGASDRTTGAHVAPHAVVDALHRLGQRAMDVRQLVERRERRRDERVIAPSADIEVQITPAAPISRIDVRSPDAPGVLYRLARVIADADLNLVGARVATLQGEVRDVFHVSDADPDVLEGLREQLRTAVHPVRS